jgi:hypothetical protein
MGEFECPKAVMHDHVVCQSGCRFLPDGRKLLQRIDKSVEFFEGTFHGRIVAKVVPKIL